MSAAAPFVQSGAVKGWCPGALRPMLTGDGLIVRVRARCGVLSLAQVEAVAKIAEQFGNGQIDLTRRANLQVRGVGSDALPDVWAALEKCDLIDASAEAEAVRNILVSPLAGIDATAIYDVREIASGLEKELTHNSGLWALPGKFGFVVDGGGLLSLDEERADIRLRAVSTAIGVRISVGVDTSDGPAWLGVVQPDAACAAAVAVALEFVSIGKDGRQRMRDCPQAAISRFRDAVSRDCELSFDEVGFGSEARAERVGLVMNGRDAISVGIGVPFGRLDAPALRKVLRAARGVGAKSFHLSPWRTFYVAIETAEDADALCAEAQAEGLVTTARSPLMSIDACAGAPACSSGLMETRVLAEQLADAMPLPGVTSVHVSGCAKGCARSAWADMVLVGTSDGIGVIHRGRADDPPSVIVSLSDLDNISSLLKSGA